MPLEHLQRLKSKKILMSNSLATYIYILYSIASDKYYVGYTDNVKRRLIEHNSKPFNTYTAKHRPWILKAAFNCSEEIGAARRIERFIKDQRSRKLIEQLIDPMFQPTGILAQLVRVPDIRD